MLLFVAPVLLQPLWKGLSIFDHLCKQASLSLRGGAVKCTQLLKLVLNKSK
jgi:hypothetical protein